MSDIEIKRLYEEAATLHKQAKDLMAKGEKMSAEDRTQVDKLLDQVEAKTAEAKRVERVEEADKFLNKPAGEVPPLTGGKQAGGENAELKAAFGSYLRKGVDKMMPNEIKALAANEATAGGYLTSDTFLNELIIKSREVSAMRRISRVLPRVESGSLITPIRDTELSDATWTTEILTGSADTVKPYGERRLTPHPLAKRILISNTLLRNPRFDTEVEVRDMLAYKFAVPEEEAFVNGTGAQQPLGILNTTSLPTYSTATSNVLTADDVINWVYALPSTYFGKPKTRILCNRAFVRKVRGLKDGLGQYVWQPGLSSGMPNAIMDTQYELSDRYDDGLDGSDVFEDNAVVAVIGDFSFYWIVDALEMAIQRLVELYAESNQVGFIGRKEADGMAILAEAFYGLKIKA